MGGWRLPTTQMNCSLSFFAFLSPPPFFFPPSLPVTDISNKTGDYPGLLATDLQVLALTCQLQAETNGPGCLCWDPQDKVWLSSALWHPKAPPYTSLASTCPPRKLKPPLLAQIPLSSTRAQSMRPVVMRRTRRRVIMRVG
ncbi:RNA-binding protein NOB1-like isoform 1-T1 [Guaruba guarouba]